MPEVSKGDLDRIHDRIDESNKIMFDGFKSVAKEISDNRQKDTDRMTRIELSVPKQPCHDVVFVRDRLKEHEEHHREVRSGVWDIAMRLLPPVSILAAMAIAIFEILRSGVV